MDIVNIVIIIIILLLLCNVLGPEGFALLPPLWNVPTRSTRRGSYDIRGDPPLGVYPYVGPWNISSDYYRYYPYYPYHHYPIRRRYRRFY